MTFGESAALPHQRQEEKEMRGPTRKSSFIKLRCVFRQTGWSFQSKQEALIVCICVWVHMTINVQAKSHLINLLAWAQSLPSHIHQVWCVHASYQPLDRFIIKGEPILHISPSPSIDQNPAAWNFHYRSHSIWWWKSGLVTMTHGFGDSPVCRPRSLLLFPLTLVSL